MTPLKSFHGAVIGPLTATNISQFLPKCHEKCMGHSKWTALHCVRTLRSALRTQQTFKVIYREQSTIYY